MKVYTAIKEIPEKTLKALIKAGFISINIHRDMQIYEKVNACIKTTGANISNACLNVEAVLNREITDNRIYVIYKNLDSEV